ncbi:MAG: ABC transporter ATP-binding protein [Bacillota bacterium]|nr:ABC transporter ATP-binding protein [Bacillota bacterium]MDW7682689.1 ABC transporter ATP-binding protein [Bacillota bacterium]
MTSLLEIKELQVSFKKGKDYVPVVDGVSFSLQPGQTLGLVGESGCGKSVTSLSIMGLLPKGLAKIQQGEILFEDKDLVGFGHEDYRKIRGKEISMIFQEPMTSLNPVFTIGNQINEIIAAHLKLNKKQATAHALEMLNKVGIPRAKEILGEFPHQLSGGMRQRVMIATAMACDPKVLIADEPTTALDVTIQAQILKLMKKLKDDFNTAIIMITHDLGVVAEMCDYVVVMYAGKIVEEGSVREIFKNPRHPYTVGLINSIPSLTEERDRLYNIRGSVPLPEEMPEGCRFASRCHRASDKCFFCPPAKTSLESGGAVSCWLYS